MSDAAAGAAVATPSRRHIALAVNVYLGALLVLAFVLGGAAWQQGITSPWAIPVGLVLCALLAVPRESTRLSAVVATVALFPVFAVVNDYGYPLTVGTFFPTLFNVFVVCLLYRRTRLFLALAAIHAAGLLILTVVWFRAADRFWYIGLLGNLVACAVIAVSFVLYQARERLLQERATLVHQKENMLVRIVATEREHIDGYRHFLHDLFNYCGVLNTGLVRARKAQQPVDPLIVDAADGLNGLSRRFRETNGHTQAGPLPVVNLGEMLSKVCSRMDGTIPTTVECPPDLRERDVHADKVAIETALLNLAVNARQAGAQRVVLTVEEVGNSTVSLVVRDDGRGIPPELTDLLFRQPVKSRQGLGVGLLAVRENLAFCGAEIHLTDANAEGGAHTTFTISGLKLASDQPPSAAAAD